MSYILDALKKAQSQREPTLSGDFTSLGATRKRQTVWKKIIGISVTALLVGLSFWLGQSQRTHHANIEAASLNIPTLVEQPARFEAPTTRSLRLESEAEAPRNTIQPHQTTTTQRFVMPPAGNTINLTNMSTAAPMAKAPLSNTTNNPAAPLNMPQSQTDFNIRLHVYSSEPSKRFALINQQKRREGDRLDAGTILEAITPDGIIINQQGQRFAIRKNQ